MRTQLFFVVPLLLLGVGCTENAPVPKFRRSGEPVLCTLKCEPLLVGGFQYTISLTNQTDDDIYLVRCLDGSARKARYPHCSLEITGPDGEQVREGFIGCGNLNTLRAKDFVKVPPGGSFDPFGWVDNNGFPGVHRLSPFPNPGVYRIRFVYSAKCDDVNEWAGDGRSTVRANEEIVRLFEQVPKIEVRSNEVTLTVGDADK